ncbi:MAG: MBL fold metallo-hydrolase [Acidilobus sp.]
MLAAVMPNGAVLLGSNVVADSYHRRPVRVVTHAHEDHTKYLSRSVAESLFIVATPVTHEFLRILGYSIPQSKALSVDYNKEIEFDGERVKLLPSRHIAGSAQVLVEGPDGTAGYTGDFKMPGTPPMEDLDVLVVDATYGSPHLSRRGTEWDALGALIDIIERRSPESPLVIYGYNGKLQEIMVELRIRGVKETFLADDTTLKLAKVASRFYNVDIGDVRLYNKDELTPGSIAFFHVSKSQPMLKLPAVHIILTGTERRGPAVRVNDNVYRVSFSDHATFWEVVEYIKESRPKKVIVDASRGFDSKFMAEYLSKVLNIDAVSEP